MTATKTRKAERVLEIARGNEMQKPRRVPPKWAKHYRRLLALRASIEAARKGSALTVNEPMESFSMHMADAGTDEFDHDLALGMLSARQDTLYEIDEALRRIDQGTYGICELTKKRIPQARLNALPWTRFTEEAEDGLERTGMVHRQRLGELRSVTGRQGQGSLKEPEVREELAQYPSNDETLSVISPIPGLDTSPPSRPRRQPVRKRSVTRPRHRRPGRRQKH